MNEWLTSPTFPLLPELPWWGMFLIGFIGYSVLSLVFKAMKGKRRQ